MSRATADPLATFRRAIAATGRRVPDFDPRDGGVAARLILLLETPGPGGDGPRLVSRDNPTGTARNLTRFLAEASISRADTMLWNAVPWIVHAPGARNRPLRRGEIREGLAMLPPLVALLPRLRVAVLAGAVAAEAAPVIARERPTVAVLRMPHPSPTYVCTSPQVAARIRQTLAEAARLLATA
ncbi:uracil-DNA glycosylase [Sphingomonas profundi]|uniref:uracil-DNA glycosylase n=1 Tax=Alterirhizorhabdus profundi TaxID=2681549 RepID=UPI0012E7BB56|nr:uracil-DNA glycosylase [Sphingomonas profundi]